jgi:hypothetical protein
VRDRGVAPVRPRPVVVELAHPPPPLSPSLRAQGPGTRALRLGFVLPGFAQQEGNGRGRAQGPGSTKTWHLA